MNLFLSNLELTLLHFLMVAGSMLVGGWFGGLLSRFTTFIINTIRDTFSGPPPAVQTR